MKSTPQPTPDAPCAFADDRRLVDRYLAGDRAAGDELAAMLAPVIGSVAARVFGPGRGAGRRVSVDLAAGLRASAHVAGQVPVARLGDGRGHAPGPRHPPQTLAHLAFRGRPRLPACHKTAVRRRAGRVHPFDHGPVPGAVAASPGTGPGRREPPRYCTPDGEVAAHHSVLVGKHEECALAMRRGLRALAHVSGLGVFAHGPGPQNHRFT